MLLEHCGVVMVEPYRDGVPSTPVIGMTLSGRINRTTERTRILYLFDEDGSAGIVTELIGLTSRMGPGFLGRLMAASTPLRDDGAL